MAYKVVLLISPLFRHSLYVFPSVKSNGKATKQYFLSKTYEVSVDELATMFFTEHLPFYHEWNIIIMLDSSSPGNTCRYFIK